MHCAQVLPAFVRLTVAEAEGGAQCGVLPFHVPGARPSPALYGGVEG